MRHGQFILYYENQQEQLIGYYDNEQYDSLWSYFDAQGYTVGEGFFKNVK
jgi:antitoxin component YwqK of YwqJK toxin-antitoxin module